MRLPNLIIECLRAGLPVRFRARGASMLPTIRSGDTLLVAPMDPDRLRPGDIVLCAAAPSRLLVHRVVEIIRRSDPGQAGAEAAFRMQGDGCPQPDPLVMSGRVLGKVAAVERRGRRIDPYRPFTWPYARAYRCMRGLVRAMRRCAIVRRAGAARGPDALRARTRCG